MHIGLLEGEGLTHPARAAALPAEVTGMEALKAGPSGWPPMGCMLPFPGELWWFCSQDTTHVMRLQLLLGLPMQVSPVQCRPWLLQ